MARYHVSEDGTPRVCITQTAESCTAIGVDGDSAPHGDFNTPEEARRFAESVLEKNLGDGLSSTVSEREVIESFPNPNAQGDTEREITENFPGSGGNDSRTLEERSDDLRESVKDFRDPRTPASQIEEIRQFWAANGVSNQFMASAESVRLSKEAEKLKANATVADRPAFSTDMTDSSEYRVENGNLKATFEGEDYDLGELREVSREEINSWSQDSFQEDANFQDGEVFPVYSDDGEEAGAYARFGDKFYRAGGAEPEKDEAPKREIRPAWLASNLRESLADYQRPHRTEARKREIEDFWSSNGISSPESAQARASELQAQADREHSDRLAVIGRDREADARRFKETSEALSKMNNALDLGSRMQPDYMQISKENKLLAQSLGEGS